MAMIAIKGGRRVGALTGGIKTELGGIVDLLQGLCAGKGPKPEDVAMTSPLFQEVLGRLAHYVEFTKDRVTPHGPSKCILVMLRPILGVMLMFV